MSLGLKSVSPSCSRSDTWKAAQRRTLASHHTAFLNRTEVVVASGPNYLLIKLRDVALGLVLEGRHSKQ
jgi:hypothetical protein